MNEENWIQKDLIKRGAEAFMCYTSLYNAHPSCRDLIYKPCEGYENCMEEKINCCYEKTIEKFPEVKYERKISIY